MHVTRGLLLAFSAGSIFAAPVPDAGIATIFSRSADLGSGGGSSIREGVPVYYYGGKITQHAPVIDHGRLEGNMAKLADGDCGPGCHASIGSQKSRIAQLQAGPKYGFTGEHATNKALFQERTGTGSAIPVFQYNGDIHSTPPKITTSDRFKHLGNKMSLAVGGCGQGCMNSIKSLQNKQEQLANGPKYGYVPGHRKRDDGDSEGTNGVVVENRDEGVEKPEHPVEEKMVTKRDPDPLVEAVLGREAAEAAANPGRAVLPRKIPVYYYGGNIVGHAPRYSKEYLGKVKGAYEASQPGGKACGAGCHSVLSSFYSRQSQTKNGPKYGYVGG